MVAAIGGIKVSWRPVRASHDNVPFIVGRVFDIIYSSKTTPLHISCKLMHVNAIFQRMSCSQRERFVRCTTARVDGSSLCTDTVGYIDGIAHTEPVYSCRMMQGIAHTSPMCSVRVATDRDHGS